MRISFSNMIAAAAAALATLAVPANAQNRSLWPSQRFNPPPVNANIAGQFDYYALILSWSPTHCSTESSNFDDQQCNRGDGKRYSFVLHGLWPQYEKGYPSDCRINRRPYVPQPLIDKMLDIMPAPGLIIHEYKKHGTCSGLEPQAYFGEARKLFQSVKVPERYKNPFEAQFVSPGELAAEFAKANPGLKPGSIAIACGGAGNRLKEIHFCFGKDGQSRACGGNENPRRMCSAERMYVPPVRSTARLEDNTGREAPMIKQNPIRRPRLIEGPNGN